MVRIRYFAKHLSLSFSSLLFRGGRRSVLFLSSGPFQISSLFVLSLFFFFSLAVAYLYVGFPLINGGRRGVGSGLYPVGSLSSDYVILYSRGSLGF